MRGVQHPWAGYEILTNLDCNLRCTYCFEHEKCRGANNFENMTDFLADSFRRDYVELKKPPCISPVIDLIGGESFLHADDLDSICRHAKRLCDRYGVTAPFIVSVSTNGTLLARPEIVRLLKRWKEHFHIGFSIDGTKENHDRCRIDAKGNGSYDRAVAGLRAAQEILPARQISVKATFTHETIDRYAESVIHLIGLGFANLAANVVFDEEWPLFEAERCGAQLVAVADYLMEKDLVDTVRLFQLNPAGLDPRRFNPHVKARGNFCGSCKYMRCLGFDGLIYGCHRFATAALNPIGILRDHRIEITDAPFVEEAAKHYELWPRDCKDCDISGYCPSCVVAACESGDAGAYYARKPQCGWTAACVGARVYLRKALTHEDLSEGA